MNETTKTNPTYVHDLDYSAASRRIPSRFSWIRRLVALLTAAALLAAAWRVTQTLHNRHPNGLGGAAVMPQESTSVLPVPPVMPANLAAFYRSEIVPLLDAAIRRNRQAADRAIESLHERFDAHRSGVRPFAEDVAGWGTRFGVIGRSAGDAWDHCQGKPGANAVGDYIQEKFRAHVLSEQSLEADVEEAIRQFRDDVSANRNQLYAEIKLPLRSRQSPIVLDDKGWDRLRSDIAERAKKLNGTTPRDTVVTGLASVACTWVGNETAELVVAEVLTGVGTEVGAEAAEAAAVAGGSAAVGGTAAGGGAGSLGGPAGTVVGLGVGLVTGAAIDWWASGRLERHVTDQCNKFLDRVEGQIVDGNAQAPGLRASFEQAVKLADEHQRQAVIDALLEARK